MQTLLLFRAEANRCQNEELEERIGKPGKTGKTRARGGRDD